MRISGAMGGSDQGELISQMHDTFCTRSSSIFSCVRAPSLASTYTQKNRNRGGQDSSDLRGGRDKEGLRRTSTAHRASSTRPSNVCTRARTRAISARNGGAAAAAASAGERESAPADDICGGGGGGGGGGPRAPVITIVSISRASAHSWSYATRKSRTRAACSVCSRLRLLWAWTSAAWTFCSS